MNHSVPPTEGVTTPPTPLIFDGVRTRTVVPRYHDGQLKRLYPTDQTRRAIASRAGILPDDLEAPIACHYCSAPGLARWPLRADGRPSRKPTFGKLAIDHIYPYSRGGSTRHLCNLVLACRSCNSSKGDRLLSEWLEIRAVAA